MIERMTDMPPGTIEFRVEGDVEREDYREVLAPELRALMESGQGLRTLYLMEDLDELEPGAMWEDARLGVDMGVRHRGDWVRSAIVTDIEWMVRAMKMFAWMIPGESRVSPRRGARGGEALGRRRPGVARWT